MCVIQLEDFGAQGSSNGQMWLELGFLLGIQLLVEKLYVFTIIIEYSNYRVY